MEKSRRDVTKIPKRTIDTAKEYRMQHRENKTGRNESKNRFHHKEEKIIIDNKKVKDNHQLGISRVLQRKGDLDMGQGGKMFNSSEEKARWRRENKSQTPKSA